MSSDDDNDTEGVTASCAVLSSWALLALSLSTSSLWAGSDLVSTLADLQVQSIQAFFFNVTKNKT